MSKEKMKNVVIYLTLFWFELHIKTHRKYHLTFLPAFQQPSVRCCKIVVIEGLSKFMSFLRRIGPLIGMLFRRIDVNHLSKASFNFSYVPVFTVCRFSDEF